MLTVIYRDGTSKLIRNPIEFPDSMEMQYKVSELQEPIVMATIILPEVCRIINWLTFEITYFFFFVFF
jgi:translation elongation factor EF-4